MPASFATHERGALALLIHDAFRLPRADELPQVLRQRACARANERHHGKTVKRQHALLDAGSAGVSAELDRIVQAELNSD